MADLNINVTAEAIAGMREVYIAVEKILIETANEPAIKAMTGDEALRAVAEVMQNARLSALEGEKNGG